MTLFNPNRNLHYRAFNNTTDNVYHSLEVSVPRLTMQMSFASAKEAGWAAARCLRQELVAILKLVKVEVLEKIQAVA